MIVVDSFHLITYLTPFSSIFCLLQYSVIYNKTYLNYLFLFPLELILFEINGVFLFLNIFKNFYIYIFPFLRWGQNKSFGSEIMYEC